LEWWSEKRHQTAKEGTIMNRILCSLALVLVGAGPLTALGTQTRLTKGKADPVRIQAMKEALADIENGHLKLKVFSQAYVLGHEAGVARPL